MSVCMCNRIPLCSTWAFVDKDHTPQVRPRELGQRPFDLGWFCIKITSLHKPKGAESANWKETLLGARMDTLDLCMASSWCLWQRRKLQEKSLLWTRGELKVLRWITFQRFFFFFHTYRPTHGQCSSWQSQQSIRQETVRLSPIVTHGQHKLKHVQKGNQLKLSCFMEEPNAVSRHSRSEEGGVCLLHNIIATNDH